MTGFDYEGFWPLGVCIAIVSVLAPHWRNPNNRRILRIGGLSLWLVSTVLCSYKLLFSGDASVIKFHTDAFLTKAYFVPHVGGVCAISLGVTGKSIALWKK